MPADDIIYQPIFSGYAGRPILMVIPGALIDDIGEVEARRNADKVVQYLEQIAGSNPGTFDVGLGVDIVQRVRDLLNGPAPVDQRPERVGDFLSSMGAFPPSNPDTPVPPEVALVIYMTPRDIGSTLGIGVYHNDEVMGSGRSSLGYLTFNGRSPLAAGQALTPHVLGGLYRITEAIRGQLGFSTRERSNYYSTLLGQKLLGYSSPTPPKPDLLQAQATDRVGFEHEVQTISLSLASGKPLGEKIIFARTKAQALGLPVLKLELDTILVSNISKDAKYDYSIPELIVGPLRTQEYFQPEIHQAKQILLDVFKQATSPTNLAWVLNEYNRRLFEEIGDAGAR